MDDVGCQRGPASIKRLVFSTLLVNSIPLRGVCGAATSGSLKGCAYVPVKELLTGRKPDAHLRPVGSAAAANDSSWGIPRQLTKRSEAMHHGGNFHSRSRELGPSSSIKLAHISVTWNQGPRVQAWISRKGSPRPFVSRRGW